MNELDALSTVRTNSSKGKNSVLFDLNHDAENAKFEVSEAFYQANGMNDNGFTAHVNNETKQAYLSVQPNDDSVSYKGRTGFEKGNAFTSTSMSGVLQKLGLVGELSLIEVGEKDGIPYFRVEPVEQEETDEIQSELVEDEVEEDIISNETVEEEVV